jgi:hypothetical protein
VLSRWGFPYPPGLQRDIDAPWECAWQGCCAIGLGGNGSHKAFAKHTATHLVQEEALSERATKAVDDPTFFAAYPASGIGGNASALGPQLSVNSQLSAAANLDVRGLNHPGRLDVLGFIPQAVLGSARMAYNSFLDLANSSDPLKRSAGLSLLGAAPALLFSRPPRGGGAMAIGGSRSINHFNRTFATAIKGDYITLASRATAAGDARVSKPSDPPFQPPGGPGGGLAPATIQVGDSRYRRFTQLTHVNNLSGATSALGPRAPPVEHSETNLQTVAQLHPNRPGPLPGGLYDLLATCPYVQVTKADVQRALTKSGNGKSPGPTGLTNDLIKQLVGFGDKVDGTLLTNLTEFCNIALRGDFIGVESASWLTDAAFHALLKTKPDGSPQALRANGGDAIRPLGIQDTLTNVACRAVLSPNMWTRLRAYFEQIGQFGCGTPSGCPAVVLAVQAWLSDPDNAVYQSDLINAFNTFDREIALRTVHEDFPELYPMMYFLFARDNVIQWGSRKPGNNPVHTFTGEMGSVQGGIFAGLLFAFSTVKPIRETMAAFPDVGLAFIVDDAHFGGNSHRALAAYTFYTRRVAELCCLEANKSKCFALSVGSNLTTVDPPAPHEEVEAVWPEGAAMGPLSFGASVRSACTPVDPGGGIISVGGPTGSAAFIATAVANRLAPSILQLDALASIAAHCPHEAMKALRFVFAAKPEFLAGCVPPGEASAEFQAFDDAYLRALRAIFPRGIPPQVFWPSTEPGGWGLPRPIADRRAPVFVLAQQRAATALQQSATSIYRQVVAGGSPFCANFTQARALLDVPATHPLALPPALVANTANEQHNLTKDALAVLPTIGKDHLAQRVQSEKSALPCYTRHILSGTSPDAMWWLWRSMLRPQDRLLAADWYTASSLVLGTCPPALANLTTAADPLGRAALTHKAGGGAIKKHNQTVIELSRIEGESGRQSTMEVCGLYSDRPTDNPQAAKKGSMRRVDTQSYVVTTGVRNITDVCCPDTSSPCRLTANTTPAAAIAAAERTKLTKYMTPGDLAHDGSQMFPIVIGPGGMFGTYATAYLRQLATERAMLYTGEEPTPAKVVAMVRSFKRRLYFQVLRGMCLQVYLYAMFRGNVIAGRPQPTSAASYGTRRHLGGYGTGQAYAIMPIPPNSNLIALHDAQRHRKSPSAGHRRKAGARR